ncbi:MAG TPA: hypothetical protein VNO30_27515 [Kofleriaceae bacterium]|nr:hypothetical protein [Kofleriaceae bacterium]
MATQKTETQAAAPAAATATTSSITRTDRGALLPGVVDLALDLADRGQTAALALLQDARIELRGAVDGGVDLAEKIAASFFRLARKSVQRADDASAETLTSVGIVLADTVQRARETSRAAAGLTGQPAAQA